ncbi:hypothetical protein HU200_040490 [Digitaria exilis]|uniref:Uncharacterized protein n=1 Tax=Digitaria exilis TaxID=1010633 RepID=A0A835EHI2_9POAL|nr:hypothetical protein HU200_040490 [Digitaria exilis]CAB3449168.1 unnamed protein product [Digitaria exilis]
MGGCFSSGTTAAEDGGYGGGYGAGEKRVRVWPSDEDGGRWPYYIGERDVDNKAAVFIANFHRHQSGVCDCPPDQTPAPATAAP